MDGLEHHWMVNRDGSGNMKIGLDGAIVATATYATSIPAHAAGGTFGNYTNGFDYGSTNSFNGQMRGIRFTLGHPRYTGAYSVPTLPLQL